MINTLRMRPDRIIVGESRGAEALDMLQAMNTGHDGSMTTVHANAPRDAFSRLETMVMMASQHVPDRVIRQQLASAIHLVCSAAAQRRYAQDHGHRGGGGRRRTIRWRCRTSSNSNAPASAGAARLWAVSAACGNMPICLDRLRGFGIHLSKSIFDEVHEVKEKN